MKKESKVKFPYQIVIVDIVIFILMMAINAFGCIFSFFTRQVGLNETTTLELYVPLFVMILVLLGFYLFVEYKFNHLKFNKILLAFGVAIAVSNLISVLILPTHLILPNKQTYDIGTIERIYCVLWGFVLAIFPYLFVGLFPRRVNSRGYVNLLLKLFLAFSVVLILASFILDYNTYVNLFTKGLFYLKYDDGIKSFLGHHNGFGYVMLLAIMATISLHIRSRNWKWSLYLVPLVCFLVLSVSKLCIVLGLSIIFVHLLIRVIIFAKTSKDNLIITIMVSSFLVFMIIYVGVMTLYSTDGLLFEFKNFLYKTWNKTFNTASARIEIWRCSFKILNTNYLSYIFGYGGLIFPNALCLVYGNNPGVSEQNIYWTHNGFIELICQGGIILLLIYLMLYAYLIYMAIKLYKKQPLFASMSLLFIFIFIVRSMFETSFLFGRDADIFATLIIALPIINEHRLMYKQEQDLRDELIKQSKKIKNTNFKSKILAFNKKALLLEAKYIAYDLNKKIKL